MLRKHGRAAPRWSTGQQCRGPSEQSRGGRDVAACERAPARRREAARPVLADRAAAIVERPELGEVRPRLLEVVAEDLLELGAAVAVDAVGPDDEALVEIRPAPLEDAVVRGVADHDVLEAVLRLVPVVDGRTRCFWVSVAISVLTRDDTSGGASADTAASAKM